MNLDNILLSSILVTWAWSRSKEKAINVIAVPTSGNRARAPLASRGYAPHASRHIGTRRESTNLKRGKLDLSQVWRRERDSNPRITSTSGRLVVISGFAGRCIKPLCHLSVEGCEQGERVQTFAPCPQFPIEPRQFTGFLSSTSCHLPSGVLATRSCCSIPSMAKWITRPGFFSPKGTPRWTADSFNSSSEALRSDFDFSVSSRTCDSTDPCCSSVPSNRRGASFSQIASSSSIKLSKVFSWANSRSAAAACSILLALTKSRRSRRSWRMSLMANFTSWGQLYQTWNGLGSDCPKWAVENLWSTGKSSGKAGNDRFLCRTVAYCAG